MRSAVVKIEAVVEPQDGVAYLELPWFGDGTLRDVRSKLTKVARRSLAMQALDEAE